MSSQDYEQLITRQLCCYRVAAAAAAAAAVAASACYLSSDEYDTSSSNDSLHCKHHELHTKSRSSYEGVRHMQHFQNVHCWHTVVDLECQQQQNVLRHATE
eukprot:21396-Heterococcus_DN1.PRE.3